MSKSETRNGSTSLTILSLSKDKFQFRIYRLALLLVAAGTISAAGDVQIEGVTVQFESPSRYVLTGTIFNDTPDPRDLILLAQISFYDKTAPKGDLPVAILRKTISAVIKPGEHRSIAALFVNEGVPPKGSIRWEPMLRIRRNRVWNY